MMRETFLALWRMFVFVALVPVLSVGLVACEPEGGVDGDGTVTPSITPELSVPAGYENYFIEDLSFDRSAGEVKVAFQINVDWTMRVVSADGTSVAWCSVEPASGNAGLHKVLVRVSANDTYEPRSAKIQLLCGTAKVAEIVVIQDKTSAYEAIDLGLSVKWASCNVGAESPEDYGSYFAWGETEEKSDYSSSTSVTYGLSTSALKSRGIIDANGNLTAAYDAAATNWGGSWRMPTKAEQDELRNNCTLSWTTQNGVNGYRVTGPNSNFIFLPAAGYRSNTSFSSAGSYGDYWSATPDSDSGYAYGLLGFGSGDYCWYSIYRYYGYTVRPVSE